MFRKITKVTKGSWEGLSPRSWGADEPRRRRREHCFESSVVPTDRNRKNSLWSRCRQQITGSSQLNFSKPADVSMSCLPFSKPWMPPGNQFEAGSPMCTSLNSVTHLACLGFELLRKVHFGGSTQVGVSEAKADLGYSPYHVHILQIDLKLLSHFVYLSWYSPRQEMSRKCTWLVLYHS